jgi:hypothetical protein
VANKWKFGNVAFRNLTPKMFYFLVCLVDFSYAFFPLLYLVSQIFHDREIVNFLNTFLQNLDVSRYDSFFYSRSCDVAIFI